MKMFFIVVLLTAFVLTDAKNIRNYDAYQDEDGNIELYKRFIDRRCCICGPESKPIQNLNRSDLLTQFNKTLPEDDYSKRYASKRHSYMRRNQEQNNEADERITEIVRLMKNYE